MSDIPCGLRFCRPTTPLAPKAEAWVEGAWLDPPWAGRAALVGAAGLRSSPQGPLARVSTLLRSLPSRLRSPPVALLNSSPEPVSSPSSRAEPGFSCGTLLSPWNAGLAEGKSETRGAHGFCNSMTSFDSLRFSGANIFVSNLNTFIWL